MIFRRFLEVCVRLVSEAIGVLSDCIAREETACKADKVSESRSM